jgi:hypothetical protein
MRKISLFVEDLAHESILTALVIRFGREYGMPCSVIPSSVRGGHGRMIVELRQYLRDLERSPAALPDLLVVGRDANCQGVEVRRRELETQTNLLDSPGIGPHSPCDESRESSLSAAAA